jgi:hypothetical protein
MILKYEKYQKLNESASVDDLKRVCKAIWEHYPKLGVS